ncbi:MAG: adenylosuccinate lyase, partial [Alphaproteobacteria bacterium]
SSDILDTSLAMALQQASDVLADDIKKILAILKKLADKYKNTLMMGRSHGMHAEPISFGFKMLGHYAAFQRVQKRLGLACDEIATCKLRGAMGLYSSVDPEVEKYVAKKLSLKLEPHATQIIPRDRHAMFFAIILVIAGSIENLALEIRHLQRSEVNEAMENFQVGQKGSSAMPHKKNPILSENLTGLARLIRHYSLSAFDNIALWHERDISHSSVERVMVPDSLILLDFALHRLAGLLENLMVNEKAMAKNIKLSYGLYYSGAVLNALTQKGLKREAAYHIVQNLAMVAWDKETDFVGLVMESDAIAKHLSHDEIKHICHDKHYLKHIERVYDLVYDEKSL